ncbi:hypothetical protein GGS20DRAFT_568909 [Poronia punctata]|nr:hypothetical protein GGS20DRAFT_568909 [Poronia punctata]
MAGFPTEKYSGIPSLAAWVRTSTSAGREDHAEDLLNRLESQFKAIGLWARDDHAPLDLKMTKKVFEETILNDALKKMQTMLLDCWSKLVEQVKQKDPLANKEDLLNACAESCPILVRKWGYQSSGSARTLHGSIYKAILRRTGGPYVSRRRAQTYNWLEDIQMAFWKEISPDWNQYLNHDIPSLTHSVSPAVDQAWDDLIANITKSVEATEPALLDYWKRTIPDLDSFKRTTKNRVDKVLKRIKDNAAEAKSAIAGKIRSKWVGPFRDALVLEGKNVNERRQKLLIDFASRRSRGIFQQQYKYLQTQLKKDFDNIEQDLHQISTQAWSDIEGHMEIFLPKTFEPLNLDIQSEAVVHQEGRLRENVSAILTQWRSEWVQPDTTTIAEMSWYEGDQGIPEVYEDEDMFEDKEEDEDYKGFEVVKTKKVEGSEEIEDSGAKIKRL